MNRTDLRPALIALVTTTVALAVLVLALSGPIGLTRPLWFWIIVCTVSELLWVRLPLGHATLSMSSCFNLAALLVLPRGEAMLAVALSIAIAESAFMRKPLVRVIFNSAQTALAVAAGALAFTGLGGSGERLGLMIADLDLLPFAAAALAYTVVNTGAVSVAVAMSEGVSPWQAWRENFASGFELMSRGALLSLGILVAVHYSLDGAAGTMLAALPLVLAHQCYARRLERLADSAPQQPARAA
jgi:hypothetical protein